VPPLPHSLHEGNLFAALRPLPLLLTDLPDRASSKAVEAFEDAGILDSDAVRVAFEAAWSALVVDKKARPELLEFADALSDPTHSRDVPNRLLDELAADPNNAGRLVNCAAMLFAYGMMFDSGLAQMPDTGGGWFFGQGSALEYRAGQLLADVGEWFGLSPTQLLNQAFIQSIAGSHERAVSLAAQAVDLDRDDVTARLVLADLEARRYDDARGWDKALATLAPLLDDPNTAVLGHAARGDAQLTAASLRSY